VGAAAALEARKLGELADHGDLAFLVQRQQAALVLQKHHALRRQPARQRVLGFLVPGGFGFGVLQVALVDGQYPLAAQVDQLLGQAAFPDGLHHEPVVFARGGGHFQVEPRPDGIHAVVHGAPVAHHIAAKAPLLAEQVGQKPAVFAGVGAV
jgi:hypothetical protein